MMLFMLWETNSGSTGGKMSHFPLVSLKIKMLKAKGMEKEEGHSLPTHRLGYGLGKVCFTPGKSHVSLASLSYRGEEMCTVYLKAKMSTPCLTWNGTCIISGTTLTCDISKGKVGGHRPWEHQVGKEALAPLGVETWSHSDLGGMQWHFCTNKYWLLICVAHVAPVDLSGNVF